MDLENALVMVNSETTEDVLWALKVISRAAFRKPELVEQHIQIIKSKLHDSDERVCAYACWTAGQIGRNMPNWYEDEVDHLLHLTNHGNDEIRENALFALGWIGRAEPRLVEQNIYSIVEKHKDRCPKVRLSMIWASENIANAKPELFEGYIEVYEDLLSDPDVKYVRGEAPEFFRVMGKKRPDLVKRSISILESKMDDECRVTQIHAKGALKVIKRNLMN